MTYRRLTRIANLVVLYTFLVDDGFREDRRRQSPPLIEGSETEWNKPMKARKQMRKWINRVRSLKGKRNGVIRGYFFDFGPRGPWSDKRSKKPRHKAILS